MSKRKGFLIGLITYLSAVCLSVYAQDILLSPQSLYFGNTPEGRIASRDILIRNLGSESLNITQIAFAGNNAAEFSIVNNTTSLSIAGYKRDTLTINFNPQSVGDKQATLIFTSNSANSPDNIDITASATRSDGVITFEKLLGTLENDGAADVQPTADGGFILCGNTVNLDEDLSDAYLVKTNAWGEIEWTKVYDSNDNKDNFDGFNSILVLEDGYLAAGTTDNGTRDRDIWVVKTDLDGVKQWDTFYGGNDDDDVNMILPTGDGSFIMVGDMVDNTGNKDGYLVKMDNTGTEIWSKTIGGSNAETFNDIELTGDGFIICGTLSTSALAADILLVKTDASGTVSWQKTYGSPGDNAEGASSVLIAADGGYVIAGSTTSLGAGARDAYIIKTDATGNKDETWGDKTFGAEHTDGFGEIIRSSDGGYLAVGSTENYYVDFPVNEWYRDVFIVKLDQNGAFKWDNVYGGDHHESSGMVRQLEDGSFIFCGNSDSYGASGDRDIYFLRISADGDLITAIENDFLAQPKKMHLDQNYPNPFNGSTTIKFNLSQKSHVQLQVYDLNGRLIKTLLNGFRQAGDHRLSFDTKGLASGLYLYRLSTDNFSETKRLLLIK